MKTLMNKLFNIILPNSCIKCEKTIDEKGIFCLDCFNQLKFITNPKCKLCSDPFIFSVEGSEICANCLTEKPYYDSSIAIIKYDRFSKEIIFKLKYHDQTLIAKKIANLIHSLNKNIIEDFDIIIPVPIHKSKLARRKFNQSALISKNIAKTNKKISFIPDLLIKTRNTSTQTQLNKTARYNNIKGSIEINNKLKSKIQNKKIILLDDVITTGATINYCSKILRKYQPKEIIVISFAKRVLGEF